MSCLLYKLAFDAAVHFGASDSALSLYTSEEYFRADTLFSALCHTAGENEISLLVEAASRGDLRLSDAMPYHGDTLFLPKPYISGSAAKEVAADVRKAVKKLRWVPMEDFEVFSACVKSGDAYIPSESTSFGVHQEQTRASLNDGADALPYQVGTFRFADDCGLWFVCLCPDDDSDRMEDLISSLGVSGIGGKTSSGLGRFHIEDVIVLDCPEDAFDAQTEWLYEALHRADGRSMLLTSSLPTDEELDGVLPEASFQLVRRSGFIRSDTYAEEPMRKETQFFLAAGSVVTQRYEGAVYTVASAGTHPVYRYSKPIFLGVSL